MKRGKIVLTPFSFTDLSNSKIRSALIVSSSLTKSADVILAFISTVFDVSNLPPTNELFLNTETDFTATGLKKAPFTKWINLPRLNARFCSAKSAKFRQLCKPNSMPS